RQNLAFLENDPSRDLLILSGDQLYRMDFAELLRTHRDSGADVTIAVAPVSRSQAPRCGIVCLDDQRRITSLVEKPQSEAQLRDLRTPAAWLEQQGLPADGRDYLANMG